jgi:hypothetical protein
MKFGSACPARPSSRCSAAGIQDLSRAFATADMVLGERLSESGQLPVNLEPTEALRLDRFALVVDEIGI